MTMMTTQPAFTAIVYILDQNIEKIGFNVRNVDSGPIPNVLESTVEQKLMYVNCVSKSICVES